MTRIKRGTTKSKRRRNILKQVKGYNFGRSTKKKQAREAIYHAGIHAFDHRKNKKGDFRRLWQIKIGAVCKSLGTNYSRFIDSLKKNNVELDRKTLADMAENKPEVFEKILKENA